MDPAGCRFGFHCLYKHYPEPGCDNICPEVCGRLETSCVDVDEHTGCYTNSTCIPTIDDQGCHAICPPKCGPGKEICVAYDHLGCPTSMTCILEHDVCESHYDPDGCLVFSDTECAQGMTLCRGQLNDRGCPSPGHCVPSQSYCPPACHISREMICSKGEYLSQDLGGFCVSMTAWSHLWEHVECETVCPAACEWSSQKACPGGYDLITGCPLQDDCRGVEDPCFSPGVKTCMIEGSLTSFAYLAGTVLRTSFT